MKTETAIEPQEPASEFGFQMPESDPQPTATNPPGGQAAFRKATKLLHDQIRPRNHYGGTIALEAASACSPVNPLALIPRVARSSGFELTPEERATLTQLRAKWNALDERINANSYPAVTARRKARAADLEVEPGQTLDAELELAQEAKRKAKALKQLALEAANPVLGWALLRLGEILVTRAHEIGIRDAQEAEELGIEHMPSPNHVALLTSGAWLCDFLQGSQLDLSLVEQLLRNPGERT